jgi:hypothetical protein
MADHPNRIDVTSPVYKMTRYTTYQFEAFDKSNDCLQNWLQFLET